MDFKKSFQALKADLSSKETTLKTLQKYYPHLKQLSEKEILAYFHVSTIDELKEHIQHTKKLSISTPGHTINDSTICSCIDAKGVLKDLYNTQELAQEEADELIKHKRLNLRVYPCPYGYGWHLTKG